MAAFSIILFVHVVATLGLVGAISLEAMAVRQLGRTSQDADLDAWLDPLSRVRLTASICLLPLFLSSGYLTDRLSMWTLAWPKIAVLVVVAFGALAGISGRRLGRIQKGVTASSLEKSKADAAVPFLTLSLSVRIGLVLAAVFLMVVKPNLPQSVGAVLGFALICFGAGLVGMNRKRQSYTATRDLESLPR